MGIHACCQKESNRGDPEEYAPGVTFRRCTVCSRRHFEMVVGPGVLGTTGKDTKGDVAKAE